MTPFYEVRLQLFFRYSNLNKDIFMNNIWKKSIPYAVLAVLALAPFFSVAQSGGFDPGNIISDERFGNVDAFASPDAIQRFLELKDSLLANTDPEFLKMLREPADIDRKQALEDPRPNLGRLRTAAELIYDAARQGGINPQVILVTLNKEQSLITGRFSGDVLQRRLDRSMGFACPDSGVCGDLFLSFYSQLFGNIDNEGNRYLGASKSLGRSLNTPGGRGPMVDANGSTFGSSPKVKVSRVGDTITLNNTQGPPNNAPASQTFVLANSATAALYRYTPHVYNGNFNFWRFFNEWFRFTNGSLIKLEGQDTIFYIDNGSRRAVSGTVLTQRGLDVRNTFTVSQVEINEFPIAAPLPPPEGTIVAPASGGKYYLVSDNQLHELSAFVAQSRSLNLNNAVFLPDSEVTNYAINDPASPPEKTLVKGTGSPLVYYVEGNKLRPISGYVFGQRKFSFGNVLNASDADVAALPKGQPLPPLDGTLVISQSSPLVYYVALGQKFPVPYYVFQARKFRFADVVALGTDEINNLTTAEHLAPGDGTVIKARGNPTVYLVEAGSLHFITGFLFQYRGYKFSDVLEVTPQDLSLLPVNSPLYLADGTLIKLPSDGTVYVLEEGNKLPLTLNAFNNRGFEFRNVIEVTTDEGARYPTGTFLAE